MSLSQEVINALLAKELAPPSRKAPQRKATRGRVSDSERSIGARQEQIKRNERRGPVRWYDKPQRCLAKSGFHEKGCGTETYLRVEGKPVCMVHAVAMMNEMVIEITEQKFEFVRSVGSTEIGEHDGIL